MPTSIIIDKIGDERSVAIRDLPLPALKEGEVAVDVAWSTLNYKDALAITGASPVVRSYPMIPGIDFAGVVRESRHTGYAANDKVILTGWGVGEKHWGGLGSRAHVCGDWLVPLPAGLSFRHAMALGTAGLTAMLCIAEIERAGIRPADGEIAVTGAAGGVGSVAVMLLAKLGYDVTAVKGRPTEAEYLRSLGATGVIDRAELSGEPRPLGKERWAGAVDVVGGVILANLLATTVYRGTVAACGLAGGMAFPATVAPFILRGVTLKGVDSVMCPKNERAAAWERLASLCDTAKLDSVTRDIPLSSAIGYARELLLGKVRGRLAVSVDPSL